MKRVRVIRHSPDVPPHPELPLPNHTKTIETTTDSYKSPTVKKRRTPPADRPLERDMEQHPELHQVSRNPGEPAGGDEDEARASRGPFRIRRSQAIPNKSGCRANEGSWMEGVPPRLSNPLERSERIGDEPVFGLFSSPFLRRQVSTPINGEACFQGVCTDRPKQVRNLAEKERDRRERALHRC